MTHVNGFLVFGGGINYLFCIIPLGTHSSFCREYWQQADKLSAAGSQIHSKKTVEVWSVAKYCVVMLNSIS